MDRNAAAVAKAAEQITLSHKGTCIRKSCGHLVANNRDKVINPTLIQHTGANRAAIWPDQDVVVFQCRFLVAVHIGLQAFRHYLDDFLVDHCGARAGRKLEKSVHGVAFYRGQVVKIGYEQPGTDDRDAHQACDQAQTSFASIRECQDATRETLPVCGMCVCDLGGTEITRGECR